MVNDLDDGKADGYYFHLPLMRPIELNLNIQSIVVYFQILHQQMIFHYHQHLFRNCPHCGIYACSSTNTPLGVCVSYLESKTHMMFWDALTVFPPTNDSLLNDNCGSVANQLIYPFHLQIYQKQYSSHQVQIKMN